jgi:hypothetical protein
MKSNFASAIERVNKCQTLRDCDNLETSLHRIWNNGILTASEFARIDSALVARKIEIESPD